MQTALLHCFFSKLPFDSFVEGESQTGLCFLDKAMIVNKKLKKKRSWPIQNCQTYVFSSSLFFFRLSFHHNSKWSRIPSFFYYILCLILLYYQPAMWPPVYLPSHNRPKVSLFLCSNEVGCWVANFWQIGLCKSFTRSNGLLENSGHLLGFLAPFWCLKIDAWYLHSFSFTSKITSFYLLGRISFFLMVGKIAKISRFY